MLKTALVAALVLGSATAQARLVKIACKPNPGATTSQFVVSASLFVDDQDQLSGNVQYATRANKTAQTSDIHSIEVKGKLVFIPAGQLKTVSIESFQVHDEDGVRMILNSDLEGPNASTLIIDRKYRYSSQCRIID